MDDRRGSRKFCQRGSNFGNVLFVVVVLVDEGRPEDPNATISGPLSARQPNVIPWRFAGKPMMAQH